jgi:hypothetical protein
LEHAVHGQRSPVLVQLVALVLLLVALVGSVAADSSCSSFLIWQQ